jgi:chromosome segregation ATPase
MPNRKKPSESEVTIDNARIFDLLQSLNAKVEDYQKLMADTQARVSGLEAAFRGQTELSNRFWTTTWPDQQKLAQVTEERVRLLERERASAEKVESMDRRVNEIEKVLLSRTDGDAFDVRLNHLEKQAASCDCAKIDKIADKFTGFEKTVTGYMERGNGYMEKVDALEDEVKSLQETASTTAVKFNMTHGILTFLGSTIVSAAVSFLAKHMAA